MNMLKHLKTLILQSLLGLSMISGAQAATTTTTYYHTDALGSVVAASDEAGAVLWRKTYDPYGNEITVNQNGDELEEQTYTGKPYDPETGLLYLNQRYYDPQIRRFMGMDPVGFTPSNPASFNRYTYANNNPYKFIDPDGRYGEIAFEAASLAVGANSFITNFQAGDFSSAGIDAAGFVLDAIGAVIPVVPGVVGLGIKAGRESAEAATKGVLTFGKDGRKLDFLFNRNISASNAQRAQGNASRIGIADTPANRAEVTRRFNEAFNNPASIVPGGSNVAGRNLREFFLPGVTGTGSRVQFVEEGGKVITIIAK